MRVLLTGAIIGLLVTSAPVREDVRTEDISFLSHSARLAGSLVLPRNRPISAAVVFVHGSGKQTRGMQWARRFAADGIAAFVYDKRGAGESEGQYEADQSVSEKNIALLADDAAAGFEAIRTRPSLRNVPIGYAGISQAGWIVPLAAAKSRATKFLVLWSGPVCKVSEEDIYSKYTSDRDFDRAPSYRTAANARTDRYVWPDFLGRDTDSREELERLSIPGLWIFGGRDGSIPVDLSIDALTDLEKKGHPYEYVLFSASGHNNMDETFATAVDWIRRTVRFRYVPPGGWLSK